MRFGAALLWIVLAAGAAVGGIAVAPSSAWAQEAKIESLLNAAIEDYDVLEIDSARQKIEQGLALAARENITAGPLLGKLYIMQGVIEYAASGDEPAVQESFRKALVAEPKMDVPNVYRTPDLEAILERAREQAGSAPVDRPASTAGISHTPLTDVDARKPVIFEAFVPRDMPVYKMHVFFRVMGDNAWKKVELQPTNAERFAVKVAGKEFHSSQFDYYISAEDRGGNTVGSSGSAAEPHNVVVLGSSGQKPNGGDPIEEPGEPEVPRDPSDTVMYVSLLFGTSPGLLTGAANNVPTAHPDRDVSAGLAMAFGHSALDLGLTLTPKMHLGLFFRFQFAPAQPFEGLPTTTTTGGSGFWDSKGECLGLGLPGDCVLGLKYKLFVNDNQKFRVFSTVGVGVGRVRNWLRLKQDVQTAVGQQLCANKPTYSGTTTTGQTVEFCYIRDTVRTGWLHFGAGGGAAIAVNDFTDIVLDTYLMVLAPATSINLDLSGGLMFRF